MATYSLFEPEMSNVAENGVEALSTNQSVSESVTDEVIQHVMNSIVDSSSVENANVETRFEDDSEMNTGYRISFISHKLNLFLYRFRN